MKLGIGKRNTRDRSADGGPAQTLPLDRGFEFLNRELRVLQRERGESREAVAVGGDEVRQLLVLGPHDFRGEVAVPPIPERIDRERSEEHTSELQSRFGISYAVFCLK